MIDPDDYDQEIRELTEGAGAGVILIERNRQTDVASVRFIAADSPELARLRYSDGGDDDCLDSVRVVVHDGDAWLESWRKIGPSAGEILELLQIARVIASYGVDPASAICNAVRPPENMRLMPAMRPALDALGVAALEVLRNMRPNRVLDVLAGGAMAKVAVDGMFDVAIRGAR